jgi:TonB family protein
MNYQLTWLVSLLLLLEFAGQAHGQAPPAADSTHPKHYTYTETMPVFPAQEQSDSTRTPMQRVMHFLNKDLHFPPKALRDGVQGKVFFSFVVDEGGRATFIKLVKGLREDVDAEVLRVAHRLDSIRWRPGTQNGRAVRVAFTVPITFSVQGGPTRPAGDSLDLPRFTKLKLLSKSWDLGKAPRAGQGVLYGTCLQRLGSGSGGFGQYVRLVNLSTGQVFRLNVKPILRSRRENLFCYALPPGRYALSQYEFIGNGLLPELHSERLIKLHPTPGPNTAATRFLFTLVAGQLHYAGTWNFANANDPVFLNEKELLDPALHAGYPAADLSGAQLAIPH